uniref:Uncharacterized protein n=1 Tax=Romanomermis culicivorax TaxID=13658 RepID=A0A915J1T3_ROMCU
MAADVMLSAPMVLGVLGPDVAQWALEFIADGTIRTTPASPFPTATVPWCPKIGVLREVHPCRGLVIDFPGEEPLSSDDDDIEE